MIAFGKNQSFYDFFVCQNYPIYKSFILVILLYKVLEI